MLLGSSYMACKCFSMILGGRIRLLGALEHHLVDFWLLAGASNPRYSFSGFRESSYLVKQRCGTVRFVPKTVQFGSVPVPGQFKDFSDPGAPKTRPGTPLIKIRFW